MLFGLAQDRIKNGDGFEAIPPALKNMPDISGDEWILESFWELSTCRAIGMTVGPIPWTAVKIFADELELSSISRDLFFRAVRYLDIIYMEHIFQEQKSGDRNKSHKTRR